MGKATWENPCAESFIENLLLEKNILLHLEPFLALMGEGYIRFSLCIDESKIVESLKRIDL